MPFTVNLNTLLRFAWRGLNPIRIKTYYKALDPLIPLPYMRLRAFKMREYIHMRPSGSKGLEL